MLAQGASAQAAEKSVIAGYNTKLAQRAAALQANNTGVCSAASHSIYRLNVISK